jgi:hypothetical protein
MEYIKIIWIIIFFIFSLNLIFIWSKLLVLFKRMATLLALLDTCEQVASEFSKNDK